MSSSQRISMRSALLPALVAVAGTWLLVGCIYIPTFDRVVRGADVSKQVGSAASGKPIRRWQTTREDVVRVLGQPFFTASDGRAMAYSWRIQSGYVSYPLCLFKTEARYHERTLVVRFDEGGLLQSYEVLKSESPGAQISGYGFQPPMPRDLLSDQQSQVKREIEAQDRRADSNPKQR